MRKETLEAYKQSFLVPTKLNNHKAVYLSRGRHRNVQTSSCADQATEAAIFQALLRTLFVSIWRNMVRTQRSGEDCKSQEKGRLFSGKGSTLSSKQVYLFFFGLVLCENTTNAVSHRMHGIRFQAIKRFKCKWFVRQHCKTSVCTHKLLLLPRQTVGEIRP